MPEVLGLVPSIVKMKMKPKQILEVFEKGACEVMSSLNLYNETAASVIPITYNGLAGLENYKKKKKSQTPHPYNCITWIKHQKFKSQV